MASIENVRNELIEKLRSIQNKDFLVALDNLISSSSTATEVVKLTVHQKEMLEMSEMDIKNGHSISQEEMDKRNNEWLSGL